MATTTNYGWVTPDDTDLVKDGAAAIRTLGSSADTTTKNLNPETTLGDLSFRSATSNVNTRIPIGSSGQHLTVVAGVPAWSTASDQTPLTTKGDLFTFSTVDARLAVGTDGQVLTADSNEATGLKFSTPAVGGGKVLQVIQASTATSVSNSTQSYTDTGLTASITPSSASSKVLVFTMQSAAKSAAAAGNAMNIRLFRGATQILENLYVMYTNTTLNQRELVNQIFLDTPSTTSATTYKTQFANDVASAAVEVQPNNTTSTIILMEIGA